MALKQIVFPDEFPDMETLRNNIQDTVSWSWNLQSFNDSNISSWLSNFRGDFYSEEAEQRIALWLLSNFTYYNETEVDHLCRTLFKLFIHTYAVDCSLSEKTLLEHMKEFSYIPLGKASESGGFIAYKFRQQAQIGIDRFNFLTDESNVNGKVGIFIDDVTLSATQAKTPIVNFFKNHAFDKVYLLTLISSTMAEEELIKDNIRTISCIKIDERDKCFSSQSIVFNKFPSLLGPIKDLCIYYGQKLSTTYPLGYKDGQYLFCFYYNTPNNTLPIFWSKKHGWIPIFERKEKIKTDAGIWRTFERYI